jgi:hypothetical protein
LAAAAQDPKSKRATGFGLWVYDARELPLQTGGNVYLNGARPYAEESGALVLSNVDPKLRVEERNGGVYLHLTLPPEVRNAETKLVTTVLLGKAMVPQLAYENADGTSV